jgi:hypothetical protein
VGTLSISSRATVEAQIVRVLSLTIAAISQNAAESSGFMSLRASPLMTHVSTRTAGIEAELLAIAPFAA